MFKPSAPFTAALELLQPIYSKVSAVTKQTYPTTGEIIFGSFKSFGGTEREVNGLTVVEETAKVETWYRPDIQSDSRIKCGNKVYEILGEPENIELRNQYCVFKVRIVKGGA